jgi:hypothetical protein
MSNNNEAPFYVGQKVVCINDAPHPRSGLLCKIKKDTVCVIEKLLPAHNGDYGVIISGVISNGYLGAFASWRFAPITPARERILYVAVSETLREQAQEVVTNSTLVS